MAAAGTGAAVAGERQGHFPAWTQDRARAQNVLAGLGVSRVEGLEKYAQLAGITLGVGDDQPAFDAAMAAMRAASGTGGLYVKVPPGRYRLRRLRLSNRAGFFCDPKTVVLEQMAPLDPAKPEVFVSLSSPFDTFWLFYGFTLKGGWTYGRAGYSGDAGESDPWLYRPPTEDGDDPEDGAVIGQTALRLHGAFSGKDDPKFRANSPVGAQNPRGRVGELEIEGFGGDGVSLKGAGAQIYGTIQVYRVGGRGLYINGYDCKLGFIDVGETGMEGVVLGPNGSANTMVPFKAWYSGGRRLPGHTAGLRMDRCSGVQLFGQLQDSSGSMIQARACRGCTLIIGLGWQGEIANLDDDMAAVVLQGDSRTNTFVINAAIGPYASQTYPTIRKLLKMVPDARGKRPRRNSFILNHEGWPDDRDIWNPAWFEGPLDGNTVIANDQIRPSQWAPSDDGRVSFGLAEPGGLGLVVGGKSSKQPGQVILIHHDTARMDHYADGVYTNGITASQKVVTVGLPLRLRSYTVDTAPSAVAAGAGASIYVVDEAGGPQGAKSDGRVWRRDSDRAVIRAYKKGEG